MANPSVVIEITSTGAERVRREIDELRRAAGPAAGATQQMAGATTQAGAAAQGASVSVSRAEREYNTLRSTLGGAERAAAQQERAIERLNNAYRTGQVGVGRYLDLQGQINRRFTTGAVNARDLRNNLAGLRGEARQITQLLSGQVVAGAIPGIGGFAAGQAIPRLFGAAAGVGAIGAVAGGFAFQRVARAGSTMRELEAQIEATLGAGESFNEVFRQLVEISNETGTGIEQNVKLFRRLSQAREDLNTTAAEMIGFEETLLQLIIASGVDSIEAAQGTRQLAQALASGRVQGDEFRTILEAMPAVARAAARGLQQMGVLSEGTIGAINRLRSEGELTARDFFQAIITQSDEAQAAFEEIPDTIGRASARLGTSIFQLTANLGEMTGATSAVVGVTNEAAAAVSSFNATVTDFPGLPSGAQEFLDWAQAVRDVLPFPLGSAPSVGRQIGEVIPEVGVSGAERARIERARTGLDFPLRAAVGRPIEEREAGTGRLFSRQPPRPVSATPPEVRAGGEAETAQRLMRGAQPERDLAMRIGQIPTEEQRQLTERFEAARRETATERRAIAAPSRVEELRVREQAAVGEILRDAEQVGLTIGQAAAREIAGFGPRIAEAEAEQRQSFLERVSARNEETRLTAARREAGEFGIEREAGTGRGFVDPLREQRAAFEELHASIDPLVSQTEQFRAQQQQLGQAVEAGLVPQERAVELLRMSAGSFDAVAVAAGGMAAGMSEAEIALVEATSRVRDFEEAGQNIAGSLQEGLGRIVTLDKPLDALVDTFQNMGQEITRVATQPAFDILGEQIGSALVSASGADTAAEEATEALSRGLRDSAAETATQTAAMSTLTGSTNTAAAATTTMASAANAAAGALSSLSASAGASSATQTFGEGSIGALTAGLFSGVGGGGVTPATFGGTSTIGGGTAAMFAGFQHGGQVAPGRTVRVGEAGPELFRPVDATSPTLIGRAGPELFTPPVAGEVVPHHQTREIIEREREVERSVGGESARGKSSLAFGTPGMVPRAPSNTVPFAAVPSSVIERERLREVERNVVGGEHTERDHRQITSERTSALTREISGDRPEMVGSAGPERLMVRGEGEIVPAESTREIVREQAAGPAPIPRQHGGPVWPGQTFLGGEAGGELFVPRGREDRASAATSEITRERMTERLAERLVERLQSTVVQGGQPEPQTVTVRLEGARAAPIPRDEPAPGQMRRAGADPSRVTDIPRAAREPAVPARREREREDSGVVVNVIDQREPGSPKIEQRQRRGPNGQQMIDMLVLPTVKRGFANREFESEMQQYGVQRRGIRRG